MAADPTTYYTPASLPTAPSSGMRGLSYVNGTWIVRIEDSSTDARIWYATDPTGTWQSITLTLPVGYTWAGIGGTSGQAAWDGTNFAVAVPVSIGGATKTAIFYATSMGGSWSHVIIDLATYDLEFLDGYWVAAGKTTDLLDAQMAYCTTLTGTWTYDAAVSSAGYFCVIYDGTYWIRTNLNPATLYYATSISGSWTASSYSESGRQMRDLVKRNGYYAAVVYDFTSFPARGLVVYGTDITGTLTETVAWSSITDIYGIDYDESGYWLLCGRDTLPRVHYVQNGAPTGTWANATGTPTTPSGDTFVRVVVGGGYIVAVTGIGNIRYAYGFTGSTTPTLLRQRQSPVRSPSRVRPPDLRQRQTPFITK